MTLTREWTITDDGVDTDGSYGPILVSYDDNPSLFWLRSGGVAILMPPQMAREVVVALTELLADLTAAANIVEKND